MDETLMKILSELKNMNSRMDRLDGKMDSLEAGHKELYQLYSGLEEHTKVTRNMVVKLSEDVDQLKVSVARLEDDFDQLKDDVDQLKDDVGQLKAGQARIESKLDNQTEFFLEKTIKQEMELFLLKKKVG